jgi:hypothetical protein
MTMKSNPVTTSLRQDLQDEMKKLAIDFNLKANDLMAAGITLIFEQHGKAPTDK